MPRATWQARRIFIVVDVCCRSWLLLVVVVVVAVVVVVVVVVVAVVVVAAVLVAVAIFSINKLFRLSLLCVTEIGQMLRPVWITFQSCSFSVVAATLLLSTAK